MIELKNIKLSFNGKNIFDDLSLKIERGEKVTLKGPSGSGKTSILNLIMHFISADSGEIFVNEELQTKSNISQIRKNITWLPQNTSILGRGTVEEVMLRPFNFSANEEIQPVKDDLIKNLEKVGLNETILESKVEDISGGEKQRIGLIICKMLKRPIMLLDEPTSALDDSSKNLAVDFLFDEEEQTILSTSHDDHFLKKCDRIVELKRIDS
jgi:putative ABC transport system ATP-binding protein